MDIRKTFTISRSQVYFFYINSMWNRNKKNFIQRAFTVTNLLPSFIDLFDLRTFFNEQKGMYLGTYDN